MNSMPAYQRFYLSGESLELWEDPDLPFRCTPEEMREYAARGQWELLFNALMLSAQPDQAE
jgi:hypothetical protein